MNLVGAERVCKRGNTRLEPAILESVRTSALVVAVMRAPRALVYRPAAGAVVVRETRRRCFTGILPTAPNHVIGVSGNFSAPNGIG
jgi:hypothetical protein